MPAHLEVSGLEFDVHARAPVGATIRPVNVLDLSDELSVLPSALRRFSADRKITTQELDDAQRAKQQIDRDKAFVGGVRDGAIEVNPILKESLERVTEMINNQS